ncbi:MAG: hypothetical protein LRY69_04730 [Gammaproteobacteria bacterium]|nr:hypothetical protein [Gammaproteobacteria bacterium]
MKIELPYVFFILTNLVTVTAQEQLFVQYPEFGAFNLSSRLTGNKKHYKFGVVSLFSNNMKTENLKLLNPCWEELINEISSKKYLSQVMQLVDEDLFTCELTISLFSFPEGGWVSPHVDNTNKVLTQIFTSILNGAPKKVDA